MELLKPEITKKWKTNTESFGAENRPPSYMADSDAHKLIEGAWRINSFVESTEEYPQWWKSRLSVAASNVDDLADYLDYAMSDDYDAETFNASKHNPYSVDLYEDEDTPPYYPYLAPEYTNVVGRGRYRFNRYGRDGMTWYQYRFSTKDKAIEWLCYQPHTVIWVKPNRPQYDFPPNTPESEIKRWHRAESFNAPKWLAGGLGGKQPENTYTPMKKDELYTGGVSMKQCSKCEQKDFADQMKDDVCRKCLKRGKHYLRPEPFLPAELKNAETRSLAKRSWDALNNVETAVGTVGLAHMIGFGAIFGGGLAFLKGRKSNSKTEK